MSEEKKRPTAEIVAEARRSRRIRNGQVLCENCNNPADKDLSQKLGWTCCRPCVWGEADSIEDTTPIVVTSRSN